MSQGGLQAIEGTTGDSAKLGMKPRSSTGRWSLKMEIFINAIILLPKAIRTSQALINALPLKRLIHSDLQPAYFRRTWTREYVI